MNKMWSALSVIILLITINTCSATALIIRDLLQFNLVGIPTLHKDVPYYFDPDDGPRRARQYEEYNGVHGEKAIERLGLGIDGKYKERLAQQKIRDEGHLGGLDYLQP